MATKGFKYSQNPLVRSSVKVGSAVGTAYGMAFLDKQVPFLTKNQWITPVGIFVLSMGGVAMTPKDSFGRDLFEGINTMSGVDTVLAFIDMGKAAALKRQQEVAAGDPNPIQGQKVNGHNKNKRNVGRVVWPRNGRRMGRTRNTGVPYVNFARG